MGVAGALAALSGVAGLGMGMMQAGAAARSQNSQAQLMQQSQMQQNQILMQANAQQQALQQQAMMQDITMRNNMNNALAKDRLTSWENLNAAQAQIQPQVSNPLNIPFGGLATVATSMLGDTSQPNTAKRTLLGN